MDKVFLGSLRFAGLLAICILFLPCSSLAQAPGDPPSLSLIRIAEGFGSPVHITHAGDGSGRIFVVEQTGRIRILTNGNISATSFLDISGRISCCGERGLLSVAFPPGFLVKNYFYVNYTDSAGDTVVARYRTGSNPDIADPDSEEIILTVQQPFPNHNGGQLAFGPDGYLYIGMGDGGSGGDPQNNGQRPSTLLGKMLRIDVESGPAPYAIPASNPFRLVAGYRPEIWALGLRNPWRFSFDRSTGDLFLGDVGQGSYEEIDFQPASSPGGENYGWRIMEGLHCFGAASCNQTGLTLPVTEYSHADGDCSVTGGVVYRGGFYPNLRGTYLYADYCTGRIWGLKRDGSSWQNTLLVDTPYRVTTFGEDEAGEVYLSDYSGGTIQKVVDAFSVMPAPSGQRIFSYPPAIVPVQNADPALAVPVSAGSVASAGDIVNIRISLKAFGGPVDMYFAVYAPDIDPLEFFLLAPDNSLMRASTGVVRWKENVLGPIDEAPFGTFPTSAIPKGTYNLYLLITPAGDVTSYYLWSTSFVIP